MVGKSVGARIRRVYTCDVCPLRDLLCVCVCVCVCACVRACVRACVCDRDTKGVRGVGGGREGGQIFVIIH